MADGQATPPSGDFTPDQIDKIQTITAGVLNSAMTARFKSFEKQLHESLGKTFEEKLKGFQPQQQTKGEGEEGEASGKGKRSKEPQIDQVQINTLQQQLQEMNRRWEMAEKQAADEREKNRGQLLRQKLSDELARIGVQDAQAQKLAIGVLVDSRKAVRYDDEGGNEGAIVFVDEGGVPVKLDVGLRNWSKTPEAKYFMPASGAKGAGTRPGGWGPQGPPPALNQQEREARVWSAIADELTK